MKLTPKDTIFIYNRKHHLWQVYLYNWQMNPCEADGFHVTGEWKTSTKVLLFPIVFVLGFFICIWDAGLKRFPTVIQETFEPPMGLREYPNNFDNSLYARMKKIYEKNA